MVIFKIIMLICWIVLGIVNLKQRFIDKTQYGLAWGLLILLMFLDIIERII